MSFELGVGEMAALLSLAIGAGWTLLQLSFSQFEKRLDAKFEAQNEKTDGQFEAQNIRADAQGQRIAVIEGIAQKIQSIELEAARNAASMNMHFVTREEYRIDQVEIKQSLNQIFSLLREMSTKLDDKVSRPECDRKMASQ